MRQITHWIEGKPWAGGAERKGPVYDPARGEQTAEVAFAGECAFDSVPSRETFKRNRIWI